MGKICQLGSPDSIWFLGDFGGLFVWWGGLCEPVFDIDADGAEVAAEHPAVEFLVGQVAETPAAFVVHDDDGTAGLGGLFGRVDSDADLGAVARGDESVGLVDFRQRTGDG